MPDELREVMEAATRAHEADVERLGDMTEEELEYLGNLGDAVPDADPIECDHTEPRLTDEEWSYVLEVNDGG